MSELVEIGNQLAVMRDSIAEFTNAARARLDWEKLLERDASGLGAAVAKMTESAEALAHSIDEMGAKTQAVNDAVNLAQALISNYESTVAQMESSLDMRMNQLTTQLMNKVEHQVSVLAKKIDVTSNDLMTRVGNMDSGIKIKIGKTAEEQKANGALETRKMLMELESLKALISDNFIFRLGKKMKTERLPPAQ